ncbi:hypothetical protein [Gallibacterium anatis]|uniref:Uncharacterized protein n=1 Tax=Gallibacterium anatis TaxID=750 RepID=A0A0A2XHJ2_9PAST|nr:hypothetical protein [Gallibacterium anatis]KGQ31831.1 hypothetical protein JP32_06195 [Gallibacterium anatis]
MIKFAALLIFCLMILNVVFLLAGVYSETKHYNRAANFFAFLLVANFALSVGVTVLSIIFILGYYLSGL